MVSTPLVIVNDMSHVLTLLDERKTDVAMRKSPQYNPMFIRSLNYIFDSAHIILCLRHSWLSMISHTYCGYLTTIKPFQIRSTFVNHKIVSNNYNPMIIWRYSHKSTTHICTAPLPPSTQTSTVWVIPMVWVNWSQKCIDQYKHCTLWAWLQNYQQILSYWSESMMPM